MKGVKVTWGRTSGLEAKRPDPLQCTPKSMMQCQNTLATHLNLNANKELQSSTDTSKESEGEESLLGHKIKC